MIVVRQHKRNGKTIRAHKRKGKDMPRKRFQPLKLNTYINSIGNFDSTDKFKNAFTNNSGNISSPIARW